MLTGPPVDHLPLKHQPNELRFEFLVGHDRYLCELRDHGPVYGVEAQFWVNEEFPYSRRFDSAISRTMTPREMGDPVGSGRARRDDRAMVNHNSVTEAESWTRR